MLKLESEHFNLRSLEPDDAQLDWGQWLADPATAAALNSVPRNLSVGERRQFISHIDNKSSYLLGIFEKLSGRLVGMWAIYVDLAEREYLLNVLVWPGDGRNQGALTETREPIYRHFFNELGMNAARINVMANNTYVLGRLKKQPWTLEHKSQMQQPGSVEPTEVCHLRMSKQAWSDFHAKQVTPP